MAGLPSLRLPPRRLGGVPVPRAHAASGRRRGRPPGRVAALGREQQLEPAEAALALPRRTDGRERILFDVALRLEAMARGDLAAGEGEERPLAHLPLAKRQAAVVLEHLERELRRGEEDAVATLA